MSNTENNLMEKTITITLIKIIDVLIERQETWKESTESMKDLQEIREILLNELPNEEIKKEPERKIKELSEVLEDIKQRAGENELKGESKEEVRQE